MSRKGNRQLWTEFVRSGRQSKTGRSDPVRLGPAFSGILLGIDPSLRGTGLAVVEAGTGSSLRLLYSETVKLRPAVPFAECLGEIYRRVDTVLKAYPVNPVVLEQTIYVQNFQTAQILGAARGAAIAAAACAEIPVFEYAPLRIKQSIAGMGRASKEQVSGILRQLFSLSEFLELDESDAAAAAVCHALTYREESRGDSSAKESG